MRGASPSRARPAEAGLWRSLPDRPAIELGQPRSKTVAEKRRLLVVRLMDTVWPTSRTDHRWRRYRGTPLQRAAHPRLRQAAQAAVGSPTAPAVRASPSGAGTASSRPTGGPNRPGAAPGPGRTRCGGPRGKPQINLARTAPVRRRLLANQPVATRAAASSTRDGYAGSSLGTGWPPPRAATAGGTTLSTGSG
jgi:hypothetical protein